jgi:hypothetical protein
MGTDGGLRQLERTSLLGAQWTSIETGATAGGVPDMEYCYPGGLQGWVENKRTLAWAVKVRPAQIGWILRRVRMGGRVWIATRRMNGKDDQLYVHHGKHIEEISDNGISIVKPLLLSSGGPAKWDWPAFEQILKS